MEVFVYINRDAFQAHKSVFGRVVQCSDTFDIMAFRSCMLSIFGEKTVVDVIIG